MASEQSLTDRKTIPFRTANGNGSQIICGTSEDRGAARQTGGRSPPSTHVLVAFRLNAPLSSLDPYLLYTVVRSRDIPIFKLLAKCREIIPLVDFFIVSFPRNL